MTKRFRPRKQKKENPNKTYRNVWNIKLDDYALTIDLADIKHISRKMYETGKISKKVLRKWRKRDYTISGKVLCRRSKNECKWLPSTVFRKLYKRNQLNDRFYWECRVCHCVTTWVYDDEVSLPIRNAYQKNLKSHRWE